MYGNMYLHSPVLPGTAILKLNANHLIIDIHFRRKFIWSISLFYAQFPHCQLHHHHHCHELSSWIWWQPWTCGCRCWYLERIQTQSPRTKQHWWYCSRYSIQIIFQMENDFAPPDMGMSMKNKWNIFIQWECYDAFEYKRHDKRNDTQAFANVGLWLCQDNFVSTFEFFLKTTSWFVQFLDWICYGTFAPTLQCGPRKGDRAAQWWNDISKVLGTTLTDHRNIVIKTIHYCFEGMCKNEWCACYF